MPAALAGTDFFYAKPAPIIRAPLGALPRRGAARLAQRLAALCRAVFEAAAAGEGSTMKDGSRGGAGRTQEDLLAQVMAACQHGIARALEHPSEALEFAQGLSGALDTLRLVAGEAGKGEAGKGEAGKGEAGKGEAGAPVVLSQAEALTRGALEEVLRRAPDAARASAALDAVPAVVADHLDVRHAAPAPVADPGAPARPRRRVPTFGHVSEDYIAMRVAADGADHAEIKYLHLRRRTFLDIVGDRPVDDYLPSDLQSYVNAMQYWPANATKRASQAGLGTLEILAGNRGLAERPLARKTFQDGYVANIRTMMRHGMADGHYRDPFAGAKIRWPGVLRASAPREGVGADVLQKVFRLGTASGLLAEALLPLLSVLTSRRLGLLAHLRGGDIREKHGVMIAQTSGVVLDGGRWQRVPIKTGESMTFFVLHDFLSDIGFVEWARRQEGWVFARVHEHPDPSKYLSKALNRLLRRAGAAGGNAEVFHSLRGDAITAMRGHKVQGRAARLQAGHELNNVHDLYGFRALDAKECQRLARLKLPSGIDRQVFNGLDFDALAAGARGRGRPQRGS